MTGDEFRTLARTTDYATLLTTLHDRFANTRLVVLEDGFKAPASSRHRRRSTVTFPKPLHACVHDTTRPWGCCVSDCEEECCEKGLGSPTVTLDGTTATKPSTPLQPHRRHVLAEAAQTRDHRVRYACLADAKGELRKQRSR